MIEFDLKSRVVLECARRYITYLLIRVHCSLPTERCVTKYTGRVPRMRSYEHASVNKRARILSASAYMLSDRLLAKYRYFQKRHDISKYRICMHSSYLLKLLEYYFCLLYTSPSPRDRTRSRMPSSA